MNPRYDRRAFLRRVAGAGLVAPVLPLAGCVPDRPRERGGAGTPVGAAPDGPLPITRPILRPGPGDAVHIVAPLRELPMAYVSMDRLQVFVDYDYRDRAHFLLDAHISVSTGLWRIRLPGDPEDRFVVPGDTPREFEEIDIAEWDPTMTPADGDFRVVRGTPEPVRIDFRCVAMAGTGDWLTGGPWEVLRCDGVGDVACREDLVEVGVGSRQSVRGCADAGTVARFLTWSCRE